MAAAPLHGLAQPILTDSGGFQVFSLGSARSPRTWAFQSPVNGHRCFLSPEE